jgi:hypothetical protein
MLYVYASEGKFRELGSFADCVSPGKFAAETAVDGNSGQALMASRFLIPEPTTFRGRAYLRQDDPA